MDSTWRGWQTGFGTTTTSETAQRRWKDLIVIGEKKVRKLLIFVASASHSSIVSVKVKVV